MQTGFFTDDSCDIDDFAAHVSQTTDANTLAFTKTVQHNIPIYDATDVPFTGPERPALLAEWADVLLNGPGVLAIKRTYTDTRPLDAATAIYNQIIADEKSQGHSNADHFAAGTNDRVWNSLQKLCLTDPDVFARVFSRPAIDAVSEAWLGPNYQLTAQINLVYPGGAAQEAHRDYHLGFQTAETAARYPAHVHALSPLMTLQGAIAHCDMPVESGPTKLLPFSQSYSSGYMAYRLPAFRAYFEENCVQVPLEKGDTLFFNPALFHAAGANTSADIHRMANLLQVSSAMGRALEKVDRTAMCKALYPVLQNTTLAAQEVDVAIAACAEGYGPRKPSRAIPAGAGHKDVSRRFQCRFGRANHQTEGLGRGALPLECGALHDAIVEQRGNFAITHPNDIAQNFFCVHPKRGCWHRCLTWCA